MIDEERLRREIEAEVSVWVDFGSGLTDATDHVEWLPPRRAEIDWQFWTRYESWLRTRRGMPHRAVDRLDRITDEVLGLLEDPAREGSWDRRGMIVGQVQSGKTANYAGLICKAADAGYKLVVVLAGIHNSLRSQTQLRLDEGFLGFDTRQERFYDQRNLRTGVGLMPEFARRRLYVHSLTTSEERGDFSTTVARRVRGLGSDPVLLVVKKNATVLRNVIRWATGLDRIPHPSEDRMVVPDLPLLLIDDEADYASVNTKDVDYERDEDGQIIDETDPTKINGLIRELLFTFEQTAFVGYTATPFANIFIYAGEPGPRYGEDLFPRSFIRTLPAPSNYLGPAQVFGVDADESAETDGGGLPIVRAVDDSDDWLEPQHKKDADVGALPDSLHEALRAFILVCAARAARGQTGEHSSMLVHVTRFVRVQEIVAEQIAAELRALRDRLRYGDGAAPSLRSELRALWERDFVPTSDSMRARIADQAMTSLQWDDVDACLTDASSRIEIMTINGSARDALAYVNHPDGLSVIAIGGDKLSRGLTLEGLSVSYYLRASRMYDTLMQMGRWFGYRPGYADLCRLYTTRELALWYRDITSANEELLGELREMAAVGATPRDFGLRVRQHPDGLLVTARTKMRHGREMQLSFSGAISETVLFDRRRDVQETNSELVERFLSDQSGAARRADERRSGNHIWTEVPGDDVATLLEAYSTHPDARRVQGWLLAKYIRERVRRHELTDWTVALVSRAGAPRELPVAGLEVGLTQRAPYRESTPETYVIRRLLNPPDEQLDLTDRERDQAVIFTVEAWRRETGGAGEEPTRASGPAIRRIRSPHRGLLLLYPLDPVEGRLSFDDIPVIGVGVSFPRSADEGASAIAYKVNNVYWQQELGLE